jgi:hypothetical protein
MVTIGRSTTFTSVSERRLASEPVDLVLRDGLLRLREYALHIDPPRTVDHAWVSHAHRDHTGWHRLTLCTPTTADILQQLGFSTLAQPLDLLRPITLGPYRIQLAEAGHIAGAAQLVVECAGRKSVYTGDLGRPGMLTTPPPLAVPCDELFIDATYGSPESRFPTPDTARAQLLAEVDAAHTTGLHAIVFANPLGRAQEVMATLQGAGLTVSSTPHVVALTRAAGFGQMAAAVRPYTGRPPKGTVTVLPIQSTELAQRYSRVRTIAVTGMQTDKAAPLFRADATVPLVDHADFDGLLAHVASCRPRRVWTLFTHAEVFASVLREQGLDATALKEPDQLALF